MILQLGNSLLSDDTYDDNDTTTMRATLLLGLLACTSALRVDTDLGRRAAMAQGAAGLAAMLAVVAPATSA